MRKKLFIACSSEGLPYAEKLKLLLDKKLENDKLDIRCEIWNEAGVGSHGSSTLDNLRNEAIEISNQQGYAVAICTPDDEGTIRGKTYRFARDNVIFEFGLFIGALGQNRVFALLPESPLLFRRKNANFYFLSDLKGIKEVFYHYRGKSPKREALEETLFKPVDDILTAIKSLEATSPSQRITQPNQPGERWPFDNP